MTIFMCCVLVHLGEGGGVSDFKILILVYSGQGLKRVMKAVSNAGNELQLILLDHIQVPLFPSTFSSHAF